MSGAEPSTAVMAPLALLSLVMGYLSWRYVELPFRYRSFLSRRQVFSAAAVASVVLVGLGFELFHAAGFPQRIPGLGISPGRYIAYNERVFGLRKDEFRSTDKVHLLVVGNSTGRDLVNMMIESGRFSNFEIIYRDDLSVCGSNVGSQAHANLFEQADAIVMAAT